MNNLLVCSVLLFFLVVYAVAGAREQQRARRTTFVDDATFDKGPASKLRQKKSHLMRSNKVKSLRSRREAENAEFYKRGNTPDMEERLKRVKKFNRDIVV